MIKVLDHGEVSLVDIMGSDLRICETARISTGAEADKGEEKNKKLIRYLYKNEHLTPFESVVLTFHVKCPIFVARQWFRHRTMSFNEASARYKEFKWECYYPNEWRKQDTKNKQGSVELENFEVNMINNDLENSYDTAQDFYKSTLEDDVAREQARVVMPVGQYTEFFMTVNLRNLFHFLELRMHSHAQWEIRQYANAIDTILSGMAELKISMEIFHEMQQIRYKVQEMVNRYDYLDNALDYLGKF